MVQKIKSDHLLPACVSFRNNIAELQSVFLLPMALVLHGVETTEGIEIFRQAMLELGISLSKKKAFPKERVEKKMAEILNRKGKDSDLNFALSVLDRYVEKDDKIKKSLKILFKVLTVHLWTVFEVLAKDLWISAVDARPSDLAKGAFNAKRESIQDDILRMLSNGNFDICLSSRMGSILSSYYDFSGRDEIVKAYTHAFGKDFNEISKAISENSELRRLQGIRNLIVHSGGIVDESYKRATATNHPVGEPIEIDGTIIRTMANSVIHTSLQLIEWVDEWLRTRAKQS